MHRALLIEEIQLCIFNQVSERCTLAALARTCQTFAEAALDVLWCDLHSFTNSIRCMPHDLWSIETRENPLFRDFSASGLVRQYMKESTLKLHRSISASDWAIFQKYSRRVRFTSVQGVKLDDACIFALCSPSAPTPLLPNLKSLWWHVGSNAHFLILPRLFSPALISLHLRFFSDRRQSQTPESPSQISFENCPSLKHLVVRDDLRQTPANVSDGLKQSVSRLQSLETIIWDTLESATIMSLARLPALIGATFNLHSNFSTYIQTLPSRSPMLQPAFSRVRTLDITGYNLASVTAFVDYFDVCLENLKLVVKSPAESLSSVTMFQRLSTALGSSSSRDTLRNLTIRHQHTDGLHDLHPLPGTCEIGPLLQFHRLESLILDLRCPFIFNDATLLAISDTWPNISTLLINRDGPWLSSAYTTPSGLIKLLERCPKLENLSLPVDFSSIDCECLDFAAHTTLDADSVLARLRNLDLGPFSITSSKGARSWKI
ncbi:hypothetical protein BJ138DRAFT_885301 [Hygrophoropsis aurantiaca]|uniref:Uncharacterized protein n=1 Tax=Hygrophoropsis aurantiaca TaxID=72124 RepID=A0ACB8AEP1_9AGAM|nr:hypothetical protein BJ138DRAFT_885301 [Hygrophoropsis aurantiaca]